MSESVAKLIRTTKVAPKHVSTAQLLLTKGVEDVEPHEINAKHLPCFQRLLAGRFKAHHPKDMGNDAKSKS